tara:strand:+ start:1119 stop:1733 length:615 start_codon:yes stop_codon:yes gene_type:complete
VKKLLITFILIITSTISLFGINKSDSNKNILFGVKIAMTFSSSGDINDISEELSTIDNAKTIAYGSSIGLYAQIKIFSFYVRPELQYSAYDTNYENIVIANKRLELPVSLGIPLNSFLSIFTGPTFRYNVDQEVNDINIEDVKNKSTMGVHYGARLNFKKLAIDIRYDRGITKEETLLLSSNDISIGNIDQRPNLLSVGLSYTF